MSTGYPDYYSGFQLPNLPYVSAADVLRVAAASSLGGESITVNYRLWTVDRQLVRGQFSVSPASDRSLSVVDQPLQEGFLLSVSCKAVAATTRGQTFLRVFLTDTTVGLGQPTYMLMSDYVTTRMAGSHPNGRVLAPIEGSGAISSFTFAAPGPGGDWNVFPPTNARWRVQSVRATFTTDAGGPNRQVFFALTDATGAVRKFVTTAPYLQPGGQAIEYAAQSGGGTDRSGGTVVVSMPTNLHMIGTLIDTIRVGTGGLQPTDQWGPITVAFEEWIDNV